MPTNRQIKQFQYHILSRYATNKRDLPRRDCGNPYFVFVSEIMLQQTQVPRVIPKFLAFIQALPTIHDLATAPQPILLSLRSGLGFNRRALNMQKTAQLICTTYNGIIPEDPTILLMLPGIGPYTAASIPAFAYNKSVAVIDINIKRILATRASYSYDIQAFTNHTNSKLEETLQDNELIKLGAMTVPKGRSSDRHNALMDYGSLVMTATKTGIRSAKQSPFTGSARQVRGNILKKLLTDGPQRLSTLKKVFVHERFQQIIQELSNEGFVKISNGQLIIN